ncbi:hypothetical protein EC973_006954 [Apophysomyces ossiformis]|uniref:Late embryogenesis abundant protein LEA-2 subgroup domain-containing protein n=1 Tax=Apophysomyces ossiformis TaxID=679940 RepID=A0A8H7BY72_9FUNG|nr:hypothetical protein EC973_006954 [Apophysomyces ossiformis]
MPTMDFAGVTNLSNTSSAISLMGTTFSINFGLLIHMQNPNILSIDLSAINASAYYPLPNNPTSRTPIGGGYLDYEHVSPKSNYNFTFPFTMVYNPTLDTDQMVLNSIAEKCGLLGDKPQDITIDYDIHVTARVLFITVQPTISSSATMPCPLQSSIIPGLNNQTFQDVLGNNASD